MKENLSELTRCHHRSCTQAMSLSHSLEFWKIVEQLLFNSVSRAGMPRDTIFHVVFFLPRTPTRSGDYQNQNQKKFKRNLKRMFLRRPMTRRRYREPPRS
jgi:hypothetical protein